MSSEAKIDRYDDGFWDEVSLLLMPDGPGPFNSPERIKQMKLFLTRFPHLKKSHGSLEEFKRYAVCTVFDMVESHDRRTTLPIEI